MLFHTVILDVLCSQFNLKSHCASQRYLIAIRCRVSNTQQPQRTTFTYLSPIPSLSTLQRSKKPTAI